MEPKKIKKFLNKNDLFAKSSGMKIVSLEYGKAVASMKVRKKHLNSVGILHGGAIFTLADFAFAAASNSYGNVAVSINATINFHNAVKTGKLIAVARETSKSNRLASYTIIVEDDKNNLVASFTGMVYIKQTKLNLQ